MKYFMFLTIIFNLFFSCSKKPDERSLIDQEKEKIRIQDQARKEFLQEEETRILNADIEIQISSLEYSFDQLDVKDENEKLMLMSHIQLTFDRILRTDKAFIWQSETLNREYSKLKTFEIEFDPNVETEKMAKAKVYIEAKKIGGTGIIEFRSTSNSEQGKLSGTIIKVEAPN